MHLNPVCHRAVMIAEIMSTWHLIEELSAIRSATGPNDKYLVHEAPFFQSVMMTVITTSL